MGQLVLPSHKVTLSLRGGRPSGFLLGTLPLHWQWVLGLAPGHPWGHLTAVQSIQWPHPLAL